ncbi:MAG: phage holin family protein [Candidatus Gastranaerophilales bacterium]|nr:phage holin family protein [Candidatus Gastranaerophilales bacterium]
MYLFLRWIGFALIIMFISWIIPGISVDGFWNALIVSVIIALINVFIKPILILITLPINILTLGLFTFVINALLFMFAGFIAPGFDVENFLSAFLGALLLSILGIGLNSIGSDN